MSKNNLELRGRVVLSGTDRGIPDLRIVLADEENQAPSMMLRAVTDESGEYCIELSQEEAAILFDPGSGQIWSTPATLYLSVYNGDALLTTTSASFHMHDLARGRLPTTIEVQLNSSVEFSVYGRVLHADGSPEVGGRVALERVELGDRVPIGVATTDSEGAFDITYDGVPESTATSTNMAILLYATDASSGDEVARTAVIVDPQPRHKVDLLTSELTDYVGQPEYSRVSAAFSAEGASNPTADDLEVLVKRTGLSPEQVGMAIQADRIAVARGIPVEASYALMKAGLPADVPGQLAQSAETIRTALQAAIDNNVVDPTAYDVETTVALYTTRKVEAVLTGTETATLDLIATSGLSSTTTDTFLTRWIEHEGSREDFWSGLAAGSEFTATEVDTLRFTTDVTALLSGFQPAVAAMQAERVAGNVPSMRSLGGWSTTDWQAFVQTNGAPADLPGDEAERETLYAAALERMAEERFPTERVARRFENAPMTETLGVPEFLDANPEFDITKTVVAAYVEENPTSMPSGFDAAVTEENLKRLQRVFTITPRFHRYDVARILMDNGIDSAASVVHMGRASFVERFTDLLDGSHDGMSGEAVAKSVYASAQQKHGFSLALMAQYGASMNTLQIEAIQPSVATGAEGPGAATLTNLFGSLDYCACEDCRSMFSPAAYLVDLLATLEGADAYTEFYSRRGDVAHLDLSCTNTNTALPYIDIVNEVLEGAVLNPGVRPTTRQTTWSSEELRLTPEPTGNDTAYDGPSAAVFPWSLPVDIPAVETREHLARLGFSRAEAMQLFAEGSSLTTEDQTAEELGMSTLEFELATEGSAVAGAVPGWQRWGFGSDGAWVATLAADVGRVMDVTGLSFDELAELLNMRRITESFVNPLDIRIAVPEGEEPSCDLAALVIHGFDESVADRVHRFLRIARRVDASWRELDIMTDGTGGMGPVGVRRIVDTLEVRRILGIPLDEGIWSTLSQHEYGGEPSVFSRIFQSNQVLADADGEFALGGSLDESLHYAHLRSGLGVNDTDLRLLLEAVGAAVGTTLDITLVSNLHARSTLARALRLRVDELLRYLELTTVDPFESPASTLEFAATVHQIESTRIGLDGAEYLCRHRFASELGLHPSSEDLADMVAGVAEAKAAVDQQFLLEGAPADVLRTRAIDALGSADDAERFIALLSSPSVPPADASTEDDNWLSLQLESIVQGTVEAYIASLPGPTGANPENYDARYAFVADTFVASERELEYRAAVVDRLASYSSVSGEVASLLAADFVALQGSTSVLDALVASPAEHDHTLALALFHKAAFLVSNLGVESRNISWIFAPIVAAPTPGAEVMSLGDLPTAELEVGDALTLFASLQVVELWTAVLGKFTNASESLGAVAEGLAGGASEAETARALLSEISGWDEQDLSWVAGGSWLPLTAATIRDATQLQRLGEMAVAVRRTGVRAEQLAAWARTAPTAAAARDTKRALRARHSEATWPDVILPISDKMRELRRDALLDFVIARGDFADADAFYEHYLLDPQMNACTMTSRLKLALSAVQLFVQRGLMGLETGVSFSTAFADEWAWKKNYRVWEANRKVFFYPENWIIPELRSDKSPFFAELEAFLQQGDVTSAHVEQAFKEYLFKLHEVSNLAIMDVHEVYDSETRQHVIHLVGRTQSEPYKYYYRRKVGKTHWTPWEAVQAGVSGEHLMLRSFDQRLFLFWLEFHEDRGPADETDAAGVVPRLSFSLATSERKSGLWSPKKLSVSGGWSTSDFEPRNYLLWGGIGAEDGEPVVRVYNVPSSEFIAGEGYVARINNSWDFGYRPCRDLFVAVGARDGNGSALPAVYSEFGVETLAPQGQRFRVDATSLVQIGENEGQLFMDGGKCLTTLAHQGPLGGPFNNPRTVETQGDTLLVSPIAQSPSVGSSFYYSFGGNPALELQFEPVLEAPVESAYLETPQAIAFELDFEAAVAAADVALSFEVASGSVALEAGDYAGVGVFGDDVAFPSCFSLEAISHPLICQMLSALNVGGVNELLSPQGGPLRRQHRQYQLFVPHGGAAQFEGPRPAMEVGPLGVQPYPLAEFDFDLNSANSIYNWEVFFYAPLMVANRLRTEGRFEDADRWYRYVFDPVGAGGDEAYPADARPWMVKPLFREAIADHPDVIQSIFNTDGLDTDGAVVASFLRSVARWMYDPFNPHAIASVRSGTYRWVAVRAYLDNLLDWADSLFRRDSIESINEATQLYTLAATILGRKPTQVGEQDVDVERYATLDFAGLFGGLTEIEGFYPDQGSIGGFSETPGSSFPVTPPEPPAFETTLIANSSGAGSSVFGGSNVLAGETDEPGPGYPTPQNWAPTPPSGQQTYFWWTFCLPPNPQLLEYWDRVADRLFKIRNCQNIEGVERALALFEPPIDPALLVRARAAGLDLGEAISGIGGNLPHYRYRTLVARAVDLCGDVRNLGAALLVALEKRDVESLSRLRASHETGVLSRLRQVRRRQVDEADEQVRALEEAEQSASTRITFFGSRKPVSEKEALQIENMIDGANERILQEAEARMAQAFAVIPNFSTGVTGIEPSFSASFGGSNLSAAAQSGIAAIQTSAVKYEVEGSLAGIRASQERRWDDWRHQLDLARTELRQIEKQIVAAEIRKAIAEKELSNLERQIEDSKEMEDFYRDKFTSQELYGWMTSELSRLYFQAYKLAFDMAKKAERAMQFELEIDDTFIDFGYWDSLRKGLLAGERLHLDIKRMESAYLEKDKRELELTKRVSLRQIDPQALLQLRETGECEFEVPEMVFDLDHAGHYLRRSRAVRVTIPAVAGPQTSIGATLTLLRDDLRTTPSFDEGAVRTTYGGTKRIATSHAREDGGLFELNFRDERYLPFEGAGVASRWSLRLPTAVRQFDYDAISDVEIRIDYTARDGGAVFRQTVESGLQTQLNAALAEGNEAGMALVLSAKKDFAVDWERFLRPADGQTETSMELPITLERFPFMMRGLSPVVNGVEVAVVGEGFENGDVPADLTPAEGELEAMDGNATSGFSLTLTSGGTVTHQPWSLDLGSAIDLPDDHEVDDLWVIVRFEVTIPNP